MKKTITFTAAMFNHVDTQGDVFLPGSIKNLDKKIPLTHQFNQFEIAGAVHSCVEDGNKLVVNAEVSDKYLNLTPAIGFQVAKSEPNEYGGRTFHEVNLLCIGLSSSPNADAGIKPLDAQ
jgi:hypothetical protein